MVPFRPDCITSSLENARAWARRVCDVFLMEIRLSRDQTLLRNFHFHGDERGNGSDDSWMVGLMNNFCVENSVGSVSI